MYLELPAEQVAYRRAMKASSDDFLKALSKTTNKAWGCGHVRSPETTQTVAGRERCRVCRRKRWNRQFGISAARIKLRHSILAAARHENEAQRAAFNLRAIHNPGEGRLPAREITLRVADMFGLTADELTGPSRKSVNVNARAVVARILRDRGISYPRIGRLIGRTDHSTAIHIVSNFDVYCRRDPRVALAYHRFCDPAVA